MNITKSISKYIPFTLKALSISIFVIIILPIVILYTMKYFQPEKIFIDNIEIVAPKDTRLYSASVDHEDIQKPYSPLLFQNTYQYTFPELSGARFWFFAISRNPDTVLFHLDIDVDTCAKTDDEAEDNFRKFIQLYEKNNEYDKYRKIESKECFGYFGESKKDISKAHVFYRKKNVKISISSGNSDEIQKVLHQFCTDIPK